MNRGLSLTGIQVEMMNDDNIRFHPVLHHVTEWKMIAHDINIL